MAVVTYWLELTVVLQCIFGRDSDTIMPFLRLAYSRNNGWGGNKNKEVEYKDK